MKDAQQIILTLFIAAVSSLTLLALLWVCFPKTFLSYAMYSDVSTMPQQAHLINFRVEYPVVYIFIVVATFIFIVLFSFGVMKVLKQMYAKAKSDTYFILQEANMRSIKAIHSADGKIVNSTAELEELLSSVAPKYLDVANRIRSEMYASGVHSAEIPLAIKSSFKTDETVLTFSTSSDADNPYSWWRIVIIVEDKPEGGQELQGFIINIDDIKKREMRLHLQEQLAEESKRKEDFLMNVSHEIRTPLNAIMGFCDYLSTIDYDEIDSEEHKQINTAIGDGLLSLSKIVNDIILFSKIENNHIHYNSRMIDIATHITQYYQRTKEQNALRNIKLRSGREQIKIFADPERIDDILFQYLSNAMKFSDIGSEIRIGWEYHLNKQEVEIFVEDEGIGIPIEKQDAAFGIFWKDNEFVPGIGIGLNIARRLTEGMKGHVRIDSQHGVGCRFSTFFKGYSHTTPKDIEHIENID